MDDKVHLETLLTALDASPRALYRPICRGWTGDYQITGKLGHILADGDGFLLYVHTGESPRRWTNVKRLADDVGFGRDRQPVEMQAAFVVTVLG
jgi:hypothetical protein